MSTSCARPLVVVGEPGRSVPVRRGPAAVSIIPLGHRPAQQQPAAHARGVERLQLMACIACSSVSWCLLLVLGHHLPDQTVGEQSTVGSPARRRRRAAGGSVEDRQRRLAHPPQVVEQLERGRAAAAPRGSSGGWRRRRTSGRSRPRAARRPAPAPATAPRSCRCGRGPRPSARGWGRAACAAPPSRAARSAPASARGSPPGAGARPRGGWVTGGGASAGARGGRDSEAGIEDHPACEHAQRWYGWQRIRRKRRTPPPRPGGRWATWSLALGFVLAAKPAPARLLPRSLLVPARRRPLSPTSPSGCSTARSSTATSRRSTAAPSTSSTPPLSPPSAAGW